jgi:hypothetical protein
MAFLSRDSQSGVPKLSRFRLPGLCEVITFCSDLQLGWGLKQTSSSPWEISNSVLHSPCTHQGWVDSRLLVVRSQIANLTFGTSFVHNLCYICPNGSCEAIFDIYILVAFHWYEEQFKVRCFDPCNQAMKFWESRRTPNDALLSSLLDPLEGLGMLNCGKLELGSRFRLLALKGVKGAC